MPPVWRTYGPHAEEPELEMTDLRRAANLLSLAVRYMKLKLRLPFDQGRPLTPGGGNGFHDVRASFRPCNRERL